MIHIIRKIEYITGDTRRNEKVDIPAEDIEKFRKELYQLVKCDTIYLTYDTISITINSNLCFKNE